MLDQKDKRVPTQFTHDKLEFGFTGVPELDTDKLYTDLEVKYLLLV